MAFAPCYRFSGHWQKGGLKKPGEGLGCSARLPDQYHARERRGASQFEYFCPKLARNLCSIAHSTNNVPLAASALMNAPDADALSLGDAIHPIRRGAHQGDVTHVPSIACLRWIVTSIDRKIPQNPQFEAYETMLDLVQLSCLELGPQHHPADMPIGMRIRVLVFPSTERST